MLCQERIAPAASEVAAAIPVGVAALAAAPAGRALHLGFGAARPEQHQRPGQDTPRHAPQDAAPGGVGRRPREVVEASSVHAAGLACTAEASPAVVHRPPASPRPTHPVASVSRGARRPRPPPAASPVPAMAADPPPRPMYHAPGTTPIPPEAIAADPARGPP
jgi:hypothetical protein